MIDKYKLSKADLEKALEKQIKALEYDREQYEEGFDDAMKHCKEAMEKQVPKKLIKTEINNDDCCPSCKHPIRFIKEGYFDLDYCLYCGQKIDWSEEE